MNRNQAVIAFGALFAVQALPPVTLAVQRTQALHGGTPIVLAVETRDPRDIFRGEYSNLAYGIGNLQAVAIAPSAVASCPEGFRGSRGPDCRLRPGMQVFIALEGDASGMHRAAKVSLDRPADGSTYVAGRVQGLPSVSRSDQACGTGACFTGRVTYGIERWYGPQGRPGELDRVPRGEVRVQARIGRDGAATLDGIQVRGEPFAQTARLW